MYISELNDRATFYLTSGETITGELININPVTESIRVKLNDNYEICISEHHVIAYGYKVDSN